jgi:hypothetical protein
MYDDYKERERIHDTMKLNNMYRDDIPAEGIAGQSLIGMKSVLKDAQFGDQMSGYEIVANFPLEQQIGLTPMPFGITQKFIELRNQGCLNDAAYIKALGTLYEWDGENWIEVCE